MRPSRLGRVMGTLLFVQLVGLILPFVLLLPITTPDFLQNAAGAAAQIRVAVLLLFGNGALTILITLVLFPVFRQYGHRSGLCLLAVSIIWFSMQAVDNAHILAMLSLSGRYAEGGALNSEMLGSLGTLARSLRRGAHYTELLVIEAWFLVFYGLLFRLSLVPRVLAGFGLVMVILHAAGITMPMFIGYSGMPWLGVSLGLSHLALAGWLIAKGFGGAQSFGLSAA
jgi:hypothetical protein